MEKKEKKKKGPVAKILTIVGIVIAAIVVIVIAYAAYFLLSFTRIADDLPLDIELAAQSEKAPDELVITSYNIGFGAYSDDYTFFMDGGKESRAFSEAAVHENINGAVSVIEEIKPDIALFQEVDFDSTRSYHVDERVILKAEMESFGAYAVSFAQNYDSPYLMYPITSPHGANKSGLMTFSKYAITKATRYSLPIETGLSKVTDLDRCYSKHRLQTENGKELIIYNLHLSAYTSNAETTENQFRMIVQDMQDEYDKGNYCIAGGDFNRDLLGDSPGIFHTAIMDDNWAKPVNMDLFTDDIILVPPFDENDLAASCRNPDKPYEKGDFVVTVDGFIRSANVTVTYTNVVETDFKYSDHNPVMIKVKLN